MSSPASRAAARDYWNSPRVVAMARVWDYTKAVALMAFIMSAGSLNFLPGGN
jgi:hypothetical protein